MPRKLSDIIYDYEASVAATTRARQELEQCVQAEAKPHDELVRYLRANPLKIVSNGTHAYRLERGQIARQEVAWGHDTWVEDPASLSADQLLPPPHTYRVPPDPLELTPAGEAKLTAMSTAWGVIEPRAGEADDTWTDAALSADLRKLRAGEADTSYPDNQEIIRAWEDSHDTDTEPNGRPVTVCED